MGGGLAAGEPYGITPYGTETMHVLRAEKGYVIVGQDTDGTVTPQDLGLSWMVSQRKGDFVGRRSHRRADTLRDDRKQLVGLLPAERLPEGAQLVVDPDAPVPVPMAGLRDVELRQRRARAAVRARAARAAAASATARRCSRRSRTASCTAEVVEPVFYDPEGARRDG